MEKNPYPEYGWIQKSIGLTMLEALRLEEFNGELEERLSKLREEKAEEPLEEKELWEERAKELSLDPDLYIYSRFEMEDKVYHIFAKNTYGISRMFKYMFSNPDIGNSRDVTLICDGECKFLMN